jgi:hypothetical protein
MAGNKKTKKQKQAKQKPPKQPKRKNNKRRLGLTTHEREYLAMILDPCDGPMSHGPYQGTGSGYLVRRQRRTTISLDGSTKTQGAFYYHPSMANIFTKEVLSASSTLGALNTWTAIGIAPPIVYSQFRPVAACVRVTYVGTELNKCGSIAYSYSMPSHTVNDTATNSPTNLRVGCTGHSRVSSSTLTLRSQPDRSFLHWQNATSTDPLSDQTNGFFFTVNTISNTAVTYEVVVDVVLEWTPDSDAGIPIVPNPPQFSKPMDAYLAYLPQSVYATLGKMGEMFVQKLINRLTPSNNTGLPSISELII